MKKLLRLPGFSRMQFILRSSFQYSEKIYKLFLKFLDVTIIIYYFPNCIKLGPGTI